MTSSSDQRPGSAPAGGDGSGRDRSRLTLLIRLVVSVAAVLGAVAIVGKFWGEFSTYRQSQLEAEDSAPIGYIGTAFRRSYHERPAVFITEEAGRKRLFAAKREDGTIETYDVGDAAIRIESLSGGFGRDSNPGIDYPIFEAVDSERSSRLRSRQPFYGLVASDGPRGYPAELLRKVEVVNDRDATSPFVIVYDRANDRASLYRSNIDGADVTFGTTGYAFGTSEDPAVGTPVLYDRPTKSLWLPGPDGLACVSGSRKGVKLPTDRTLESTTWSDWRSSHPDTRVLMGNDRSKPIPES